MSMRFFILLFVLNTSACVSDSASPTGSSASISPPVEFRQLAENVWLHTSYLDLPKWGLIPSNGLVVANNDQVTLIDTAWNNDQTAEILDWVEKTLKKPITHAIFTHAHEDKMGGVETVQKNGIATYAAELSNRIAPSKGLTPARHSLQFDAEGHASFVRGVQVFYPGPGHTEDNIVIYLPESRILFGGCLIRPGGTSSLGNVADADIGNWDHAVEKVMVRYNNAELVIPSHGPPADRNLLEATIMLAKARQRRE